MKSIFSSVRRRMHTKDETRQQPSKDTPGKAVTSSSANPAGVCAAPKGTASGGSPVFPGPSGGNSPVVAGAEKFTSSSPTLSNSVSGNILTNHFSSPPTSSITSSQTSHIQSVSSINNSTAVISSSSLTASPSTPLSSNPTNLTLPVGGAPVSNGAAVAASLSTIGSSSLPPGGSTPFSRALGAVPSSMRSAGARGAELGDIDGILPTAKSKDHSGLPSAAVAGSATLSTCGSGMSSNENGMMPFPPASNGNVTCSGVIYPTGIHFESQPFASPLPTLRETPQNERAELFRKKLQICSIVFDFNRPNLLVKEKEAKRTTLCEIVEYVNNARSCFNEQIMKDVVNMVASNIFRALPPSNSNNAFLFDADEEEPTLEQSWPHLQIVYEFFLRFVVSQDVDAKVVKRYIEQQFVLKLLDLFHSEDPRERDYLKTILHRIYGKIMALRSFIRKAIQHVFFRFVYECEAPHGVAELLEILGSIINGFALPLKEEHKSFLEKSLIPLHKARRLTTYHQYLLYCMTQYVEKDHRLAEPILIGLLRFWPVTNTFKEVLFVNEVEEILELTQAPEFQRVMEPLFKQMAICIQSPHFQVAERVLFLWNNDYIVKMINQNRQELFPIIIKALYRNSKDHWNTTVNGLTYNVSKLLAQADPVLFDECSDKNLTIEERKEEVDYERSRKWRDLEASYNKRFTSGLSRKDSSASASD